MIEHNAAFEFDKDALDSLAGFTQQYFTFTLGSGEQLERLRSLSADAAEKRTVHKSIATGFWTATNKLWTGFKACADTASRKAQNHSAARPLLAIGGRFFLPALEWPRKPPEPHEPMLEPRPLNIDE